jgi:hypothetical protein
MDVPRPRLSEAQVEAMYTPLEEIPGMVDALQLENVGPDSFGIPMKKRRALIEGMRRFLADPEMVKVRQHAPRLIQDTKLIVQLSLTVARSSSRRPSSPTSAARGSIARR